MSGEEKITVIATQAPASMGTVCTADAMRSMAAPSVLGQLIELRRSVQESLGTIHKNNTRMLLVKHARLNAIQDCINIVVGSKG